LPVLQLLLLLLEVLLVRLVADLLPLLLLCVHVGGPATDCLQPGCAEVLAGVDAEL
jgi:hypothetical protein